MLYEAQLANLTDDDDDDDTIVRDSPRYKAFARNEPETVEAPSLPAHWERHFWATPESHPLSVSWKNTERSETTQRILRTGTTVAPSTTWRSTTTSWKAKAGAIAMLGFFVSAIAAIAVAS